MEALCTAFPLVVWSGVASCNGGNRVVVCLLTESSDHGQETRKNETPSLIMSVVTPLEIGLRRRVAALRRRVRSVESLVGKQRAKLRLRNE